MRLVLPVVYFLIWLRRALGDPNLRNRTFEPKRDMNEDRNKESSSEDNNKKFN